MGLGDRMSSSERQADFARRDGVTPERTSRTLVSSLSHRALVVEHWLDELVEKIGKVDLEGVFGMGATQRPRS